MNKTGKFNCAVPENIHTPSTEGKLLNFLVGAFSKAKKCKEMGYVSTLIGISRGVEGLGKHIPSMEVILEPHNIREKKTIIII